MTSSVLPLRRESASEPARSAPVVFLDGSCHPTAEVGGKASSLDVLLREGFAVPPAAAATTAYRDFVGTKELAATLSRLRPELTGAPDEADRAFAEVEQAFLTTPMPPGVADELGRAANEIAAGSSLAVRSSALLVLLLFLVGEVFVVYLAIAARRDQSVSVRRDLWSWLRDREELTGEPADRIAERAVAAYRTRLDGGIGAGQLSDAPNASG